MVETVTTLISTLGFPIVMVGYFIYDRDRTVRPLIDAINGMNTVLSNLLTKIDSEELMVNKAGDENEK